MRLPPPSLTLVLLVALATPALAQPDVGELEDLLKDLTSTDFAARERATGRILAIGEASRVFLEAARNGLDLEGRLRVDAILSRLATADEASQGIVFESTRVHVDFDEIPIDEATRRLGLAAGVPIRYGQVQRGGVGAPPGQRVPISFSASGLPFFEALDRFCVLTGCTFNSDYATGGLVLNPTTGGKVGPVRYDGPMRIAAMSMSVNRTTRFVDPPTTYATLQVRINVEPQARLLGLLSPVRGVTAKDGKGNTVRFTNRDGPRHMQSLTTNFQVFQAISMEPPATNAKKLVEVRIPLELVVPTRMVSADIASLDPSDAEHAGAGSLRLKVDSHHRSGEKQTVTISFVAPIAEGKEPLRTLPQYEEIELYDLKGQRVEIPRRSIARRRIGERETRTLQLPNIPIGRLRVRTLSHYEILRKTVVFAELELP